MASQKSLYQYNQERIHDTTNHDSAFLNYENHWIEQYLATLDPGENLASLGDLIKSIERFVAEESSLESVTAEYVSQKMTRQEFQLLVEQFAIDGLTEAQVFYYVMPRLELKAQLPLLRILIDEFGSANPSKVHTALFVSLLQELNMPVTKNWYIDRTYSSSYEFVNMFYWLALRADDPSYFVGALTYLETVIPVLFPCMVDACARLNISAHHYYSEHCHIDKYHAIEGKNILRAMAATHTLDVQKAWQGVQLSSLITNQVFDEAVSRIRKISEQNVAALEEEFLYE